MKLKSDHILGNIIKIFREEEGYTQPDIGELLYETKQSISKKEKGLSSWNLNAIIKLSEILKFKIIVEKGELEIMKDNFVNNNDNDMRVSVKKVEDFGRFSIIEVYSNSENGVYGNISPSMEDILNERNEVLEKDPESKIMVGYCLYDNQTEYTPNTARDWHNDIESAKKEYYNFFEVDEELDLSKIRKEIINYFNEHGEDMAIGHIDAWKNEYWGRSLEQIEYHLDVNYDMSGELEFIEERLGINLTDVEAIYVERKFMKEVMNLFRDGFKHLI